MKALLVLAAVAGTAYVGYSYNATDGESCLVCPMTGEPVFTSAESDSAAGSCCASGADAMLTGIDGETSSCCSESKPSCCSEGSADAMLTSVAGETSSCCSKGAADAMLTSVDGEAASSCASAKGACCSKSDAAAMLTSTDAAECTGDCDKACCKDKTDAVDVAAGEEEVVAAATETE